MDRAYMELALYGVSLRDLDADPRPSRIQRLLNAARVMDARRRLEDWEDTVNTNGMQGETVEYTPNGTRKAPPKNAGRTVSVGHDARRKELEARAYPERVAAQERLDAKRADQAEKKAAFWGSTGIATAVKVKVEGERITVLPD